jgi:hypothetical protein
MESLENSLSIIIQGPLHERILESYPYYLSLVKSLQHKRKKLISEGEGYTTMGELVISYWEGDDEKILEKIKDKTDIKLVKNYKKNLPKSIQKLGSRGASPWILQNYSTSHGLKECTGNICIKVRSDEIYPFLINFYKKIKNNMHSSEKTKFFTSDIFFRRDEEEKFHISDHIIGSLKCYMIPAFEESTLECTRERANQYKFPEQLICQSILRSRNINPKHYKSKSIMQDNFEIVPITEMPNSIWTCSYRKYDKLYSQESGWVQDIKNI